MHLLLNKCMFGRQMEMEFIMDFLLQEDRDPSASEDPAVLPITGPGNVGKSMLATMKGCATTSLRFCVSVAMILKMQVWRP
jgi:hypothetical protein